MSEHRLTQTEVSLNPPAEKWVNITINGTPLQVPIGENLIESAKRVGVDIPYFCYHPRLSKGDAANCRMCLVEVSMPARDGVVRKMPKPQAACTMPAAEGMVIDTETESVLKDRRGVLEFLLINHPLDCPVCDRGGECPLQNNTLFYGPPTSRYIEEKRHFPKAYPLSEHVVFDRERCIHCARCTRFTEDISGDEQLGFLKRGADMEVGTFAQTSFQSKFSGNVIELCPVGALLSRNYRFKARPWDLHSQRSVCTRCSNGCNIKLDYRLGEIQRVNARVNEEVNEEWTCDRGKFGHDYISADNRLKKPLLRKEGVLTPVEWSEAYEALTTRLTAAGANVGAIGGARCTNEDNFLLQRLFRETLKSNNLDSRLGRAQGAAGAPLLNILGHRGMDVSIASIEDKKTILVLGSELAEEQPILFLRVRKAWRFKGASVISMVTRAPQDTVKVGDFAALELVYKPGSEVALIGGLLNVLESESLVPEGAGSPELTLASTTWPLERAAAATGLSKESFQAAARLLVKKGAPAVIVGNTVTEDPQFDAVVAALARLAQATGASNSDIIVPGTQVNTKGAMDMGILPDTLPGYVPATEAGMNTRQMLEAAAAGKLAALWIVGADPVKNCYDPELARKALENCPFVVVNELAPTATTELAHLVLPAASAAEKDGTYTNCEGRVQRIYKAFEIAPDIKPDWLIFSETAALMGTPMPYLSARDILLEIARTVEPYAGLTPKSLGDAGVRLNYKK